VSTPDSPFGRIGVFGSLFNPPHLGHVVLCTEAAWQLGLERVILVPTGSPSHRATPRESAEVRARLAVAAASTDPVLSVSRVEVDREGPSYMADTLRELQQRHAGHGLVLLLGADQLAALGSWYEAESLPKLARIAVALRPGIELHGLDRASVDVINMPPIGISSSMVRERVRKGQPIRHLVPEAVRRVIEQEGLYRGNPANLRADRPDTDMLGWAGSPFDPDPEVTP
jgi:nicotinate-nucleotide adenylyltransferase